MDLELLMLLLAPSEYSNVLVNSSANKQWFSGFGFSKKLNKTKMSSDFSLWV